MEANIKTNHRLRLKAFDLLQNLRSNGTSRENTIRKIHSKFGINTTTLSQWYLDEYKPCGRKGELVIRPELFYVLGALLGDGCLYNYKLTRNYIIVAGEKNFAKKYADIVAKCINTKTKAYPNRNQNIWFVKSNNYKLYSLFKKVRENLHYLEQLIKQNGKKSALLFLEGFFDAEGCIKVIKEKIRKTPKICPDICNTNFDVLELCRKLFEQYLNIEARFSSQKGFIGKDGSRRKKSYHLRIYKKGFIKKFLENINTIKLKKEKEKYVYNWINNGL